MAFIPTVEGNPANTIGGPGTCRAKWRLATEDGDTGQITNAMIVAAFGDADVPAELLAAINAVYPNAPTAALFTVFGMRFELAAHSRVGPGFPTAEVGIDGGGKLVIDCAMSDAGEAQIVLQFNHSATR